MSVLHIKSLGVSDSGHVDNYLTHSHGVKSWLLSLDHKRIGLMYMCLVLTAFFLGGMFALCFALFSGPTRRG